MRVRNVSQARNSGGCTGAWARWLVPLLSFVLWSKPLALESARWLLGFPIERYAGVGRFAGVGQGHCKVLSTLRRPDGKNGDWINGSGVVIVYGWISGDL